MSHPVQTDAARESRALFIIAAFVLLFTLAANAQYSAPRIFFSDLQSGPNTGGQNNLGAIVTIYGQGFGATQGSSTVSVGGAAAASYLAWSDTKVSFQPGPAATSGNLVINVAGKSSNAVPFTVRSGNIYFVSVNGNDSNNGSYSHPWFTLINAANIMVPGDIAYAMNGVTQTGLNVNFTSLAIAGSGSTGMPEAIVAYPGAQVTVGSATGEPYGIQAFANHWVIAGLTISGGTSALILLDSSDWRLVGNDFSCPNGNGPASCVQGTDVEGIKLLGNKIHDNGSTLSADVETYDSVAFTGASQNLEVGWNSIVRTRSCRALQFYSAGAGLSLLNVHDNLIQDAVCSGISFANVDASAGAVTAYNNVISHVGTGPAPGGVEADAYACISAGGSSASDIVLANNTMYDCGARANATSGAVAASAPFVLTDNILDVLSGESYFSTSSMSGGISGNHNLLYGGGAAPAYLSATVIGNPDFVAPASSNFQLQADSPAIDAGVPDIATWDFNGVPRPQGIAYDIGAYEYSVAGTGLIVASPTTVNFGNVYIGSSSTQAIAISNTGTTTVTLSEVFVSSAFTINGLTLPLALAPETSASYTVTFAPTTAGTVSATESLNSNASNSPTAVVFSGTGVEPVGQLTVSPASLSFGSVTTGTGSSQTVTVTASATSVTISQASLTGTGFSFTGPTLPLTLTAGKTASFTLTFAPTTAASVTGSFSLVSNSSSALTVSLTGAGANPAGQLTVSPAALSFGTVNIGSSSSQAITVTAGATSVIISQASLTGTGFSFTAPTLPLTLAAGKTASFTVQFAPATAANVNGTFSLVSNSSDTLTVSLTGAGANPTSQLTASPAALNFGNVATGTSSSQTVTVTAGAATVIISQAILTGTGFSFTGPTLPLTLAAGKTASFTVQFAPTAAISDTGGLSLVSNASNADLAIALSGTGATRGTHSVTLAWNESVSSNVVGYLVYRGTRSGGPYTQITAAPITTLTYTDFFVVSGATCYYVVTAVGNTGQQSAYSSQTVAVVPTP